MVPISSLFSDGYYVPAMVVWLAAGVAALIICLKLRRRCRGSKGRTRLVSAALSAWFVIATFTAFELATALFYDQSDSFARTKVAQRWFRLHVATNDSGFRDALPLKHKLRPGQRHIVFVGDSFTFGHGVNDPADRFSDRVAAALEQRSPGAYTVSNASVCGMDILGIVDGRPGPPSLLDRVVREGPRCDMLVYTFVPNDIEHLDDRTDAFYQGLAAKDPRCPLIRHTYFLNLAYFRLQSLQQPDGPGYFDYLVDSYDPEKGPAWERLQRKLDALIAFCRGRDIELRVALFPFLHNLGPDYPFADAHRRLTAFLDDRGVRRLDLRDALEPHIGEGLVVNRFDAHPNERAHARVATAMLANLFGDL